jgi:hypothetical protein
MSKQHLTPLVLSTITFNDKIFDPGSIVLNSEFRLFPGIWLRVLATAGKTLAVINIALHGLEVDDPALIVLKCWIQSSFTGQKCWVRHL